MKTKFKFFIPMCMLTLALVVGCGPSGGEAGDANDPATTDDSAQMQDESGEV